MPLSSILARMQARGVTLDVDYLNAMAKDVRDRMATLQADIYRLAGEEFNLNSPPQLRAILYDKLGLSPGKRTPKGQLSTDASVLEKLRDQHPIVDALLSWSELDKLNSTYLEALPRLVDPATAAYTPRSTRPAQPPVGSPRRTPTCRTSRSEGSSGRQIRRAFIAGSEDQFLLVADYSQIELRILAHLSGRRGIDVGVPLEARHPRGDGGPCVRAPRGPGRPPAPQPGEDGELRAGLRDERLRPGPTPGHRPRRGPGDHGRLLRAFPRIRDYLDRQVARAAAEGFTETMLGRRRYIPELQASNPRVRDLGRRMALNAPIQGGAADVFKLGMIRVDRAIARRPPRSTCCSPCTTSWSSRSRRFSGGGSGAGEEGDGGRPRAVRAPPGGHRLGPELGGSRAGRPLRAALRQPVDIYIFFL